MANKMGLISCMMIVLSCVLIGTATADTHIVGDELGWNIPPLGDIAYRTWAADEDFEVGDVLVFNFTTGVHDVAEVTRAAFDSCNASNPISISTTGPTNITLNTVGTHYYICTFARHCGLGQKLAINVTRDSDSPPPAATPAPRPPTASPPTTTTTTPDIHVVGDELGWTVPPLGDVAYRTWAADEDFEVGDILVFNFTTGVHDVAEVTREAFDSCNVTNPISISTTGPTNITLTTVGAHYYICTFARHCGLGQKLAINVTRDSDSPPAASTPPPTASSPTSSPPPAASTPPPSTTTPPPSSAPSNTPPAGSTPSTPSPAVDAPPPPPSSSAPSFSAAALPFAFFSIALAFLY